MTMNEQLRFFADNGYVVVGGALTAEEVAAVNAGIDADRAAHPRQWDPGHRPYHMTVGCNVPELMQRTEAVDGLAHHPAIAPLVKKHPRAGGPTFLAELYAAGGLRRGAARGRRG